MGFVPGGSGRKRKASKAGGKPGQRAIRAAEILAAGSLALHMAAVDHDM